jgi:hypothetical protein
MDLEKRITNLENLVYALIKRIDNDKFYSSADVGGVRKSVSDVTPYKETKTAYIGDTEVTFYDVPEGNVTICFDKPYTMEKVADRITLTFDELDEVTEITISIL